MKKILLFTLLALPFFALTSYASSIKFSSFTIDIPDNYEYRTSSSGIEVFDMDKKNLLLILVLPDAKKGLDEYTEALIKEYKGRDIEFDEETLIHSFTFEDANYGECNAITREFKNKYLFINMGGNNKAALLDIANTIK